MEQYVVYTGTFSDEHQYKLAYLKFYFGPMIIFEV